MAWLSKYTLPYFVEYIWTIINIPTSIYNATYFAPKKYARQGDFTSMNIL